MSISIGRLTGLNNPNRVILTGDTLTLGGVVTADTLAELHALRDELRATAESEALIAIAWTVDGNIDAFYRVEDGSVGLVSLTSTTGAVVYSFRLMLIGRESETRLQSALTGKDLSADVAYTPTDDGLVTPPPDAREFLPASAATVRDLSSGGTIRVRRDVPAAANPSWSSAPDVYYTGACKIIVDSQVRCGERCPNTPQDWSMDNEIVRVSDSGGADGSLTVEHWDGTDWRAETLNIRDGGADVGDWDSIGIIHNLPERTTIRLAGSRSGTTKGRITLDLTIRRGDRNVKAILSSDDNSTALEARMNVAATTTGAPDGVIKRASADGQGHRWMLGSQDTVTQDTANGAITKTDYRLPFVVSKIIDSAAPDTGDSDDDLWEQYMENRVETVREVGR